MDNLNSIQEKIKKLFILSGTDAILWCDYSESNPDQEKILRENQAVSKAEDALKKIDARNGYIAVSSENIDLILTIREAILLVNHHDTGSWNRSRAMLLTNQLLSYCKWEGNATEFEDCSEYNATSCTLSKNQLKYYLWWREEARLGEYHICTHKLLWVYIYDLLTDTCYPSRSITLNKLIEVEKRYLDLAPDTRPKSLTHQKLRNIVFSYAVYNNLWDEIKLLSEYEFDDEYNACLDISNGIFKGHGKFLYSIATSKVKNNASTGTAICDEIYMQLSAVFEKIYPVCIKQGINISSHLTGTLDKHSLWDPYGLTYLTEETLKLSANPIRTSFAYGENKYILIDHDDMVSEKRLQSVVFSLYHNDNGATTEKKNSYYRKCYSGATPEGHQIVDYTIRSIQNYFRVAEGKSPVQQFSCPYINIKDEIDGTIRDTLKILTSEQYNTSDDIIIPFNELSETKSDDSTKFIYPRILRKYNDSLADNGDTDMILEIMSFYEDLFEEVPQKNRIERLNKEEIAGISFERDVNMEAKVGIENLALYLYHQYGEFLITGEIYSDEIYKDFTFSFKAYDKDNDVIECSNNNAYSGEHEGPFYFNSNTIKRSGFFNRYPFSTSLNNANIREVSKIKMRIDIEDE